MISHRHGSRSDGINVISSTYSARKTRRKLFTTPRLILLWFLSLTCSFYGGVYIGWSMERPDSDHSVNKHEECTCSRDQTSPNNHHHNGPTREQNNNDILINDRSRVAQIKTTRRNKQESTEGQRILRNKEIMSKPKEDQKQKNWEIKSKKIDYIKKYDSLRGDLFSPLTEYVDREEFIERFEDLGVPFDKTVPRQNDRVMIVYGHQSAFPDKESIFLSDKFGTTNTSHPNAKKDVVLSVDAATKNCNNLHVVLTNQDRHNQCIALVGQYESFHVQKFMRASTEPDPAAQNQDKFVIDPSYRLRPVNRGMKTDGGTSIHLPTNKDLRGNWKSLTSYLQTLENTLEKLRPIAASVAKHNNHNAIVIMVCNFGQSELLTNFVCNARAKGLEKDLSNILLFSTDQETHELATSDLGLKSFYDPAVFGSMPKQAAGEYADDVFRKLMFAKVYCVHLVSMLGHDLLFQDVDIFWYKNPLLWFHDEASPARRYDMVFQDDGSRTLFYAPYAANSGFYYARNNARTQLFFNSLLFSGDLIMASFSHQIAISALVSEHVSLYGLKVKVWDRSAKEFPGGYLFHEEPEAMKQIIQGKIEPFIFHMCWTENKEEKVKYIEQLGQWYMKDSCKKQQSSDEPILSGNRCCSTEPIVRCHFRDKPSAIPCLDAPTIDEDGQSFW